MLDTDDMEERRLWDSLLLEESKLIDFDDTKELGKSEDTDAGPDNPEVSESMVNGEDDV